MARPGISTKNTEKIPLGPKFWNAKEIPKKYRENTKNAHFWYFGGIFSVFSGYFGGKFWESRISGRGVFFSVFLLEIRDRAISGLCSRSGRSQIEPPSAVPGSSVTARFAVPSRTSKNPKKPDVALPAPDLSQVFKASPATLQSPCRASRWDSSHRSQKITSTVLKGRNFTKI